MIQEDPVAEMMKIKERISKTYGHDVRKIAAVAQRLAGKRVTSRPASGRKFLPDHPIGRSVGEDDEIVREVRQVREKLLREAGGDLHRLVQRANREATPAKPPSIASARKRNPARGSFRSSKGKTRKT